MKALCNHFARKIKARYESDNGYIEFGDGKCEDKATHSALKFLVKPDTTDGLDHVNLALDKHYLRRFTPEEDIQFDWRDVS